jgi:hypothetical protein
MLLDPTTAAAIQAASPTAWFVYNGWLTVEIGDDVLLAISPAPPSAPHWCYRIEARTDRVQAIGGGNDLAAVVTAADAYARTHARAEWWQRQAAARLDRHAASGRQNRLISGLARRVSDRLPLNTTQADAFRREARRYAAHSRAVASGLIGHLKAQDLLRRHASWHTDAAADPASFTLERLRDALAALPPGVGLPPRPSMSFEAAPFALPFIPTPQFTALTSFLAALPQQQALGIITGPPGVGSTALLHAYAWAGGEAVPYANLADARTPAAQLRALADAVLGTSAAVRHRRLNVRDLALLLEAAFAHRGLRVLLLDHVTAPSQELLHLLQAQRKRVPSVLVLPPSRVARLEKLLAAQTQPPPVLHQVAPLSRLALRDAVFDALLAALGASVEPDERPWASDELWRTTHDADEGVRWAQLLPRVAALWDFVQRNKTSVLSQEAVRRALDQLVL